MSHRLRYLWVLALALLGSGVAEAQPYVRTHVKGKDFCIYWDNRDYVYHVDSAGYSKITTDAAFKAVDSAFGTWQTLSDWCSGFKFEAGARVANPPVGYTQGGDNQNVITFREANCEDAVPDGDACLNNFDTQPFICANKYKCWFHGDGVIALTTATYNTTSGIILDADIELNAAPQDDGSEFLFTTVPAPPCSADNINESCVAEDIQNTLTHEIGHVIGLDHQPTDDTSTMYASAPPGETRKRIIDNGTSEGFCSIYPRAGPSITTCDLTSVVKEEIRASNTGSGSASCTSVGGSSLLTGMIVAAVAFLGLSRRRKRR